MFYRFILIILILTFAGEVSIFSQEKVKGGYKKCTVYSYKFYRDKFEISSKHLDCIYKYDENGNVIEVIRESVGLNKFILKATYLFDKYGNIIQILWKENDGTLKVKNNFKYNEKGKKIECLTYMISRIGPLQFKAIYKYDQKGNMVECIEYDSGGNISTKSTNKYNEKCNLIETFRYNLLDKTNNKSSYKYDDFNNVIELIYYDEHYKPEIKFEYIYSK